MAIRFKFRSSVNFDSLDIGGQTSISIRDLKAKIIHHKNLISKDFDLVFSDAITGQEYDEEKFQIPSGSSIIIRRVPAAPTPLGKFGAIDTIGMTGHKNTNLAIMPHGSSNNFDDFGVDLCPEPDVISYNSNECDKVNGISIENTNTEVPRIKCSEPFISRCQGLESSDLSEAVPERKELVAKVTTKIEECLNFEQVGNNKISTIQSTGFPSELKCSLCKDFYKEAVMIPCCQHSFCRKCISSVLGEKQGCPKCTSTKCWVDDLLPNLSLRQAIEHFLGSQISACDPESGLDRYAPDGESGIHAKDVSCAVTVHQSEAELPHSSACGMGSNKKIVESTYPSMLQNDPSIGDSNYSTHFGAATNWKKGPWSGGNKSFAGRMGVRSCYTCGSLDHLMRDCPAASARFHMGQENFISLSANYFQSCWNGALLPQVGAIQQHMYGNPGMFTFNSAMCPAPPPYTLSTHVPPIYGAVSFPSGIMGMGVPSPPPMRTPEYASGHLDHSELRDLKGRHNSLNDNIQSDESGRGFNKRCDPKSSNHHRRSHIERENFTNDSEDCYDRRSERNHWSGDFLSPKEKHRKVFCEDKRPQKIDQIRVEKHRLERSKNRTERRHTSHSGSDSDHHGHRRAMDHDRWHKTSCSDERRYDQKRKKSR